MKIWTASRPTSDHLNGARINKKLGLFLRIRRVKTRSSQNNDDDFWIIRRLVFFSLVFGIALGYGLEDQGSRVRFPAEAGNFPLHHRVQNGCGAHPATYTMGTRGSFPGVKAAGA
jgi:hypothetical protein